MPHSLPWMSAFQPRLRHPDLWEHGHSAANSARSFPLISAVWLALWTDYLGPLGTADRESLGDVCLFCEDRLHAIRSSLRHLWVPSLFFLASGESGSEGGAWVSRGRAEAPVPGHGTPATLPLPLGFSPAHHWLWPGPASWFQLKLGRKDSPLRRPAWSEDTVSLYLPTAKAW